MTEDRKDYRCKVTLLLDDVTEYEARQFFADGAEVEQHPHTNAVYSAMIEAPGPIEVQP